MSNPTVEEVERQTALMIAAVWVPDSMPRKIIDAKRENHSDEWNETEDRKKSEQYVGDFLDNLEEGIKHLTHSR